MTAYQQLDLLAEFGSSPAVGRSPAAFQVGDRVRLPAGYPAPVGRVVGVRSPKGLAGCISVDYGSACRWIPADRLQPIAAGNTPAPEHRQACPWDGSGWLEEYTVTRSRKKFRYWRYCWRGFDGKKKHKHVPSVKLPGVQWHIRQGHTPDKVIDFLRRALR